jgi:ketosteroid isomerase-like protein
MSQENMEVARRIAESLGGSDVRFPGDLLAPDVEWVNPPYAAEPGIRRGKPAFEQAAASVRGALDLLDLEVQDVIDAGGDTVVMLVTMLVRGRSSGVEHLQPQGYVWTVRDGRAVRFEWFNSHSEALESAGLRE